MTRSRSASQGGDGAVAVRRRTPATSSLLVLLVAQACAAVAFVAFLVVSLLGGSGAFGSPDPGVVGVLSVAGSMLVGLVVLAVACVVGLWRGRPWAGTMTGLLEAFLVVGAGVGLLSLGWQPVLGVVAAAGVLGLLLIAGRHRGVPG